MNEPAPTTVTHAVEYLQLHGYTDEVFPDGTSLSCRRTNTVTAGEDVIVDHTFRFEGNSDPGDEAIVLGLRCRGTDIKAILVSAFGPGADPATADFLAHLHQP